MAAGDEFAGGDVGAGVASARAAAYAARMAKASGRNLSYAERAAGGRPTITLPLTQETLEQLAELAEARGTSRSQVVIDAVSELAQRVEKKSKKKKHMTLALHVQRD